MSRLERMASIGVRGETANLSDVVPANAGIQGNGDDSHGDRQRGGRAIWAGSTSRWRPCSSSASTLAILDSRVRGNGEGLR